MDKGRGLDKRRLSIFSGSNRNREKTRKEEQMRARRDLTNAALALFIKHYFSIPWLREYLLNRKIKFEIENKLFDDETISDFLFLIRMCHDWSVTAKSLSEIMTRFEDLDSEKIYSYRHGTSPFLMSSYFFAHITAKMRTPDENLSELWRQVAMMPMEDQYKFDYYSLAKKREADLLGYNVERKLWELLEQNRQLQRKCFLADIEKATKTILEPYLTAEWRTRSKMELQHYFDDRIKYYRFLSDLARATGNNVLSDAWEQVAEEEEEGIPGTLGSVAKKLLPLKAWSLERATNLTSSVRTIYQIAFQFFESGAIGSGKDILKLAMSVEDLLKLLKKWKNLILQQKYTDKLNEPEESSMTKLFDIIEIMIAHFQDQLVTLLNNARVENFSGWNKLLERMRKKIVKHKDDYESHYREFQLALVKFNQLSLALKQYDSFIAVLKTRMDEYRSELTNYFEQEYEIHCILEEENGFSTPSTVGASAGFSMYSPTACHSQFFLRFPYEKELLTYVEKIANVSETTRVSELFQVVVDEILHYISTVVLSIANVQIYSRKGFKLDAYYDRYFTGMSKALAVLSLKSDVQSIESDLDVAFIYCYRDLIQYHGIDSKKAGKLYYCLAEIWTHRVSQEDKIPELMAHWRTALLYFQKSSYRIEKTDDDQEEMESNSIVVDENLDEYHKKVYYHAGLQFINLVGLATKTRTSPCKMEFLIEVATYFEEERTFQANCSFLRGALNFFSIDGKTTSPSANDVLGLQIENLNVVDNPWIEKWNSLAIEEVLSPAVDIMYSSSPPFGEEKILILTFLYETLLCAVNRWELFYEQWSLLVLKLNEIKFRLGRTSLRTRSGLLKRLQAYDQYTTENETAVKKLELEDMKRICNYVVQREYNTTDPKMARTDSLKNALKLFNQGLKLFDLETSRKDNEKTEQSIVSEDQIYLCFRLSTLYLKLDDLLAQQTAGTEKLEEEIETVSANIQLFITENPMVKTWFTE
jgi:hypothetical protein